jgi:hypothetical protein
MCRRCFLFLCVLSVRINRSGLIWYCYHNFIFPFCLF